MGALFGAAKGALVLPRASDYERLMPLAIVTGAGVRLGRAIARELGLQGYDLLLHANRSRAGVEELASELTELGRRCVIIQADLANEVGQNALIEAVRAETTQLDLIVHNAGLYEEVELAALTRAQHARMMAVNLETPLFVTQGLLPLLQAAPAPSVVCISDAALHKPYTRYSHYMLSKAGVDMLVQSLALELAPRIRVNAVAPGTATFPKEFSAEKRAAILSNIPLGREGTPEDIARAVAFLASPQANYITGTTLRVDGGWSIA